MKSFLFTLIFCNCFFSYAQENNIKYINPFQPIWCEGDDLSYANPKPTVLYKEVEGTRIEIPNMPAYKMQSELGECRAFALAVLIQKNTCVKWEEYIPDCKNPPANMKLDYFGVAMYTHKIKEGDNDETFQPNQTDSRDFYDIIVEISKSPRFILESCKPYYKLVEAFSTSGQIGIDKRDNFFAYLKKMYETKKEKAEDEVKECPQCLIDIYNFTGMESQYFNLKKALSKDSYEKFLYSLFFNGCKLKGFADFYPNLYPDDSKNIASNDLKKKILEGLKKEKPIMTSQICLSTNINGQCDLSHAVVLSGYRKVCDLNGNCKELFKVHNSWGEEWQKKNNNGWVDAEILINSNARQPNQDSTSRINSGSVIWLE